MKRREQYKYSVLLYGKQFSALWSAVFRSGSLQWKRSVSILLLSHGRFRSSWVKHKSFWKSSLRAGSLDRQGRRSRNREPAKPARRMGRGLHFSSPHSSRRLRRLAIAAPPPLPIKWACSQAIEKVEFNFFHHNSTIIASGILFYK